MTYQVFRTDLSSYQTQDFILKEKEVLEKIQGVQYHLHTPTLHDNDQCVLMSNTNTRFDLIADELVDRTSLIIHPNSGHNNIKENFVKKTKAPIVLGNSIRAHAVVEFILSAIFKHYCTIPNHFHWHENRDWDRRRIKDAKCTIIGHGMIGSILGQSLAPLIDNLHIIDPHIEAPGYGHFSKKISQEAVQGVEILILTCSLNDSTKNMINGEILKSASEHLLLINASRGEVIVEDDLKGYLVSHPKSFAFLDVYQNEPFPSGFMSEVSNINKTSHIAGVWRYLNDEIIAFENKILSDFVHFDQNKQTDQFINKYSDIILKSDQS